MLTFLHSSLVRKPSVNLAHDITGAQQFLSLRRALIVSSFLLLFISGTKAQENDRRRNTSFGVIASSRLSSVGRKRVITLRRRDTSEGSRLTFTSDAPLDDYKSYVEGERLFILIPECALISSRSEAGERGFADMRIEERNGEILLSFRLEQGSTVSVSQNFNRLDVVFMTNERANSAS
jgi:hypothetical protein